jgi:hypothetical protein
MQQNCADFLADEITAVQLDAWADLLPVACRVLGANLFGDMFVADAAGAIHMLEISAASIAEIAASEDDFHQRCVDDSEGWLLRPLADRCRSAGMLLGPTQCYAFTTLPLFGGEYKVDNIWICTWKEWLSFTATIYAQTKDLSDGSSVAIKFVD